MTEFLQRYFPNAIGIEGEFVKATGETLYMVGVSAIFGGVLGILLGVSLVAFQKGGVLENKYIFAILDKVINTFRSIPFIILLALLYPVTRFIVGTSIGINAAIVPITFGITPFFARQIQNSLLEVDPGIVEAAKAMGSSPLEILFFVYLREARPGIIRAASLSIINLIGITAMAGAIGAGGLGNLAITRGYNRFQTDVAVVSTIIVLLLVFFFQWIGDTLTRKVSH